MVEIQTGRSDVMGKSNYQPSDGRGRHKGRGECERVHVCVSAGVIGGVPGGFLNLCERACMYIHFTSVLTSGYS